MVFYTAPVDRLVVPAVSGVSFPMPEFAGWKVQVCQSANFDVPGGVGYLSRSDVNRIHTEAASGTLVGVRLRTAYLAKVVGVFEVPSVLKFERALVNNEREDLYDRLINSYLSGDGTQPPILSPYFWSADYAPLWCYSCASDT